MIDVEFSIIWVFVKALNFSIHFRNGQSGERFFVEQRVTLLSIKRAPNCSFFGKAHHDVKCLCAVMGKRKALLNLALLNGKHA